MSTVDVQVAMWLVSALLLLFRLGYVEETDEKLLHESCECETFEQSFVFVLMLLSCTCSLELILQSSSLFACIN